MRIDSILITQAYGLRNDMLISTPAIDTALSGQFDICAATGSWTA